VQNLLPGVISATLPFEALIGALFGYQKRKKYFRASKKQHKK